MAHRLVAKIKEKLAFTLGELLVVVAIIGVLVAISIPIFTAQLEKSRNATDIYNAQVIAHAIQIYYMSNPDAIGALKEKCGEPKSVHSVIVKVIDNQMGVPSILQPALDEAGLLGNALTTTPNRFDGIKCKSTVKWKQYTIAATTWEGTGADGHNTDNVTVHFLGKTGTSFNDSGIDAYLKNADATGFRDMVTGQ